MAKLTPTYRHNPCPLCADTSGDCREGDNTLIYCHRSLDEVNHPDYIFRKLTQCGVWGIFAPRTNDWSEARRREWEEKQQQRQAYHEKQRQKALQDKLTRDELDTAIRKLSNRIGLSRADRERLQQRGLTDPQIDQGLFFSVCKHQPIPFGIPPSFPGVGFGRTLTTSGDGIACIVWDRQGRAIGIQIRYQVENNKYRWLKHPHLKNGELPLTYCQPSQVTRTAIGRCEGILKPYIASELLGQEIIGASGGSFSRSPQQLAEYLKGHKVVNEYPDGGDVLNETVMRRWEREISVLENQGFTVLVGWWGQVTKDSKDIDELSPDELGKIRYIRPQEFYEIATREQFKAQIAEVQKKLHSLTYPVDWTLNQKYLPNLVGKVPTIGILGLKCRKGGGKSTQINQQIANAKSQGKRVISITPRIALGRSQAVDWQIEWIENGESIATVKINGEFVDVDQQGFLEFSPTLGLCWDSLWKLASRDWANTVVIIDESELGFSHLATSSTCRDRRSLIFKIFETKIPECLANGGQVILSDADLSDVSIDYIKALAPVDTPLFLVENTHKGDPWEIDLYSGKADEVEAQIFNSLELGENIVVATDNQKEAEALERQIIVKFPELAKSVIRIDRKATAEDWGKDFVNRPNESVLKEQPRVLIYTPSMGTGVSLDFDSDWDKPYFHRVFGLFFGQLEPSQCRQMLIRYRRPVPRTIYVREVGNLSGNASFLPEQIKKQMFSHHEGTAQIIDLAMHLAREQVEDPDDDQSILPALINQLQSMMGNNGWDSPHVDLYAKVQARRNFGLSQLAIQLHQELIEEGHLIMWDEVVMEGNRTGDEIKETKQVIREEEAEGISASERISPEEADRIKYSPSRTEEQDYQLSRFILCDQLPGLDEKGMITPDFVMKAIVENNGRWLKQHRFFWDLINFEATQERDRNHWKHNLKKFSEGVPYLPDIRTYSGQVQAFIESGLFDLLDLAHPEKEFNAESPEVQQFMKRCQQWEVKQKLRIHCQISVKPETDPIKLIGKMAKRCGLKIKLSRTEKTANNGKIRHYYLDPETLSNPDRLAVLQALDLKLMQTQAEQERKRQEREHKRAERKAQKEKEQAMVDAYRQQLETEFSQEIQQQQPQANHDEQWWEWLPLNRYQIGDEVQYFDPNLHDWRWVRVDSQTDTGVLVEWLNNDGSFTCTHVSDQYELLVPKEKLAF